MTFWDTRYPPPVPPLPTVLLVLDLYLAQLVLSNLLYSTAINVSYHKVIHTDVWRSKAYRIAFEHKEPAIENKRMDTVQKELHVLLGTSDTACIELIAHIQSSKANLEVQGRCMLRWGG
jgi:hypothetical protein